MARFWCIDLIIDIMQFCKLRRNWKYVVVLQETTMGQNPLDKIPTCTFIPACMFILLEKNSHLYVYSDLYYYSVL